uniref:Uncharacterized protein n=1 Tax=Rhizophora mucronata TaxID=61149 RepID=A0A2P2P4N3_RHIMU
MRNSETIHGSRNDNLRISYITNLWLNLFLFSLFYGTHPSYHQNKQKIRATSLQILAIWDPTKSKNSPTALLGTFGPFTSSLPFCFLINQPEY